MTVCISAKFGTAKFGISRFGTICDVGDRLYSTRNSFRKKVSGFSAKNGVFKHKVDTYDTKTNSPFRKRIFK